MHKPANGSTATTTTTTTTTAKKYDNGIGSLSTGDNKNIPLSSLLFKDDSSGSGGDDGGGGYSTEDATESTTANDIDLDLQHLIGEIGTRRDYDLFSPYSSTSISTAAATSSFLSPPPGFSELTYMQTKVRQQSLFVKL